MAVLVSLITTAAPVAGNDWDLYEAQADETH